MDTKCIADVCISRKQLLFSSYYLIISYAMVVAIIYYVFSAGLAQFLTPYPALYYLLVGGQTDFTSIHYALYGFILLMGLFSNV